MAKEATAAQPAPDPNAGDEAESTPASPPSAVPPAPAESNEGSAGDGFDWGEFADELTGDSGGSEADEGGSASPASGGEEPAAPSEPKAPEPGSEEPPKPKEEEVAEPQEPPAETLEEETPPLETPRAEEEPTQPTPEDVASQREEQRQAALARLKEAYKLSDQQVDDWEINSADMLPEVAAQLHMNVFEQVFNAVTQQLPQMVRQINSMEMGQKAFSEAFFTKWPKLADHAELVNKYLQAYGSVYPNATHEQLINDVGMQASVALKLPIDGLPPGDGAAAAPAESPKPKREVPFSPAQPGGGTASAPTQSNNQWSEFINDED